MIKMDKINFIDFLLAIVTAKTIRHDHHFKP